MGCVMALFGAPKGDRFKGQSGNLPEGGSEADVPGGSAGGALGRWPPCLNCQEVPVCGKCEVSTETECRPATGEQRLNGISNEWEKIRTQLLQMRLSSI